MSLDASKSRQNETAERVFQRYFEELGIDPEELRGKKVLDIGNGDSRFARYVQDAGITSEVYSLDKKLSPSGVKSRKAVVADAFHTPYADDSFDFVISNGSMPILLATNFLTQEADSGSLLPRYSREQLDNSFEQVRTQIDEVIREMLRVVKPGQAICFGKFSTLKGSGLFHLDYFRIALQQIFERLMIEGYRVEVSSAGEGNIPIVTRYNVPIELERARIIKSNKLNRSAHRTREQILSI